MAFLNTAFEDVFNALRGVTPSSSGNIASPISGGTGSPAANVSGSNYSNAYSTSNTDNTATVGQGALYLRDADLNTGLQLGQVAGDVTFNGGADLLADANSTWLSALDSLTEQSAATTTGVVDKVLQSLTGLSESAQTDGASRTKQYLFWGALAALALAAVYWFTHKK